MGNRASGPSGITIRRLTLPAVISLRQTSGISTGQRAASFEVAWRAVLGGGQELHDPGLGPVQQDRLQLLGRERPRLDAQFLAAASSTVSVDSRSELSPTASKYPSFSPKR